MSTQATSESKGALVPETSSTMHVSKLATQRMATAGQAERRYDPNVMASP